MCGRTQVNSEELQTTIENMKEIDPVTDKTCFQTQFEVILRTIMCALYILHYTIIFIQVLNQVTPNCEETKSLAAQKNEHKNRTMKYLPRKKYNSNNLYICTLLHSLADNHRVLLRQEDSDYIHASFINVSIT